MAEQIRYDHYLHGGDYNPEQWLDRPDILKKDIEYFKKAHINTVSMGMFSWAVLEPEEGRYNFDWLEEVIDNLYKEGIYTILSTPSGARPKWMADKYEEVLRMDPDRTRRFSVEDIITVILLQYTGKKSTILIRSFLNVSENIPQCFCGIFPMNMAENATVLCAGKNSGNG